jgi:hypothetical protein
MKLNEVLDIRTPFINKVVEIEFGENLPIVSNISFNICLSFNFSIF